MGVRREYMFQTRDDEARPVRMLTRCPISLCSSELRGQRGSALPEKRTQGGKDIYAQIRVCDHQLEYFPGVDHVP